MTKLNNPLFSFDAKGRLGQALSFLKRGRQNIVEASPEPPDAKTLAQLSWRHMFLKAVALWHALSASEKEAWESGGRLRHMTGYAWFISQALRPNPGIYLPLQGGTMQGEIDMATNKISAVPDPIANQDADTKAARNAAIAAALAGSLHCDIYGYDGSNWQTLLVESAALKNLRVRLYDGADGIDSGLGTAPIAAAARGLVTKSLIHLWDGSQFVVITRKSTNADNVAGFSTALPTSAHLMSFDGAGWDRLRSYNTGILKVGRAEIGLSDLRRVNAGQVKASPGTLYWMTMNPTAANSVIELTDDLDGLGVIKWDMTHGVNAAHHMNFDPPLEFATGIYLKTLTNFTSVIFGYK